jgi:hypothetical protein
LLAQESKETRGLVAEFMVAVVAVALELLVQ